MICYGDRQIHVLILVKLIKLNKLNYCRKLETGKNGIDFNLQEFQSFDIANFFWNSSTYVVPHKVPLKNTNKKHILEKENN
jgi:hypothetical protein